QAFAHTLAAERAARPIWPWLTLLAVVLLPVDIALRRLVVTRRDWERLWAALTGWRGAPVPQAQRSEQVGRLFAAKTRAPPRRTENAPLGQPAPEPVPQEAEIARAEPP